VIPWPDLNLPADKTAARAVMSARLKTRQLPNPPDAAEERLFTSSVLPARGWIGIYRPMTSEAPLPRLLSEALRPRVALVRAREDKSLEFVPWDGVSALEPDALGMLAPPATLCPLDDTQVAAVLVPGLAFMQTGQRMGRGLGCYDRTLGRMPGALRIAVTSEMHLVASLPSDALDIPVQVVVTELRTLDLR